MEDEKKKKKFSFLKTLGFSNKNKNPSALAKTGSSGGFSAKTAEEIIRERKKKRQELLDEMGD